MAEGSISPEWRPNSECGFGYALNGSAVDSEIFEQLVRNGLAKRVFFDRISRCPHCRSPLLNMREVCPLCKSSQIEAAELLHHFSCGYVGAGDEFTTTEGGRLCPKCGGAIRNFGSDHDSPGPLFHCAGCGLSFQLPEMGARCMSCAAKISGERLTTIIYEDVFAYGITPAGEEALATDRLTETRAVGEG